MKAVLATRRGWQLVAAVGCASACGHVTSTPDATGAADGSSAGDALTGDGGPPDAGTCPTLPPGGEVREWAAVLGSAWPSGTSNVANIVVPDPGYLAIRFTTGNVVSRGVISDVETTAVTGVRSGTISECQGDFRAELPASCKHSWGIGGGLRWSTQATPAANECPLKANTTYYFNTTFMADVYDPSSSTCSPNYPPPYVQDCVITLNHTEL